MLTVASTPVQWFDWPGEPTGPAGDLTATTFGWLSAVTSSVEEAEHLTLAVFARAQEPLDAWLVALPTLTRLKVLTITTLLRHRRGLAEGTAYASPLASMTA